MINQDSPLSPSEPGTDALTGLFPEEIAARMDAPLVRGRQLFQWLHKRRTFDIHSMTDLSKAERARMENAHPLTALVPVQRQTSRQSGTLKVLFELADKETIESVLLTQGPRITLCLSSQAGCALGCSFCATGQAGFRRNLSPAEIVEQALRLVAETPLQKDESPNIVLMGMGEPFQNYDAVLKSIRLLMHPGGMHIGARKITVSTAGDVAGIVRFAEEPWQVRLSVSLHAAEDELRSRLVPLNKRYPLHELHRALEHYQEKRNRQITFEWVLMQDVNDSPAQARALAGFIKGLDATVNLIPWNAVPGLSYQPSPLKQRERFMETLKKAGVKATLRKERGDDIDAACGQLRNIRHNGADT